MKRPLIYIAVAAVLVSLLGWSSSVGAVESAVSLRPLKYETKLSEGERKRGVIDITNPTAQSQKLTVSVEGFEQIDDEGALQFYADEAIEAGVKLDLKEFSVPPHDTMRFVFELDGSKLPDGDVFAAILFETNADDEGMVRQRARMGTLLLIENGTPAAREAIVTGLSVERMVFDGQINGVYRIKNTASEERTGFRPEVTLRLEPWGSEATNQSALVFSGRERANQFSLRSQLPGVYRISASYGGSSEQKLVVLVPWYLWIIAGLTVVILIMISRRRVARRRPRRYSKRR